MVDYSKLISRITYDFDLRQLYLSVAHSPYSRTFQYFINLGPLVLKAYIATSFSFIDNGVDRTRPASNGLNPAQVPF